MSPSRAWTAADLAFDAETHTSTRSDGLAVPHVTAVLGAVGVTEDFRALADISPRVAQNIALAGARGTATHADCHAYDDDDLDLAHVDARVLPYLNAWIQVRADKDLEPLERERRLYHPTFGYTGIMDGVFAWYHLGRRAAPLRVLLDIKTGDPSDAAGHLQTAAYEAAYVLAGGAKVDRRWAVWLVPGMSVPYRVVNYTARPHAYQDFQKFLACLTVYNEQPDRRERIR